MEYRCLRLKDFMTVRSSWPLKYERWLEVAETLGYKTITEMLYDLYVNQGNSFRKIEKIIGFSRGTIRQKIAIMKVTVRGRGGANNPWGLRRKPENRIEGSKWYPNEK